MSISAQQEPTLARIIGSSTRRALLVAQGGGRASAPHRASLGTAFIGIGAALVCAVRAIYGFSWFISLWDVYPNPVPALTAWIVLIVALVATFITARVVGDNLPDWMFALFLIVLAFVFALDLLAIWPLHDIGSYATAAPTAAMSLLLVITLRNPQSILAVGIGFGLILVVAIAMNVPLNVDTFSHQLTTVGFAVLPVVIGVYIVRGFRRMVQIELARVLVQSTVSAPRFAVGMLASEELARLDLAAEEILESVATGRNPLPLHPRTASLAASLATELRLHLIEGRRETWLYHAVTESEMLGKSVTLVDKGSLAGLLDPSQRDGLLSAIWLLVNDNLKMNATRTLEVRIGPMAAATTPFPTRKLRVPIVITTKGIARNRIDPSTWEAARRVGKYSDSPQNGSLRVDIECFVDNPADL